jgi:acetoin utilization deacetylase AcuC-like enzyme
LHHAKYDRGEGFCTFNGPAIAAKALLDERAVESVLMLDLDAHCGGTSQLIDLIDDGSRTFQAEVSGSHFNWYPNTRLTMASDPDGYLPSICAALHDAETRGPFGLCPYNAGMDPHQAVPIGGLHGIIADILAERERTVFDWCRTRATPVAFVLAGGYIGPDLTESALVNLHRLTISKAHADKETKIGSCR